MTDNRNIEQLISDITEQESILETNNEAFTEFLTGSISADVTLPNDVVIPSLRKFIANINTPNVDLFKRYRIFSRYLVTSETNANNLTLPTNAGSLNSVVNGAWSGDQPSRTDSLNTNMYVTYAIIDDANSNISKFSKAIRIFNPHRADAAEGDIDTLQSDLNTAEGNITTLQSDLNTAEADLNTAEGEIDTLQADLNTAESDIRQNKAVTLSLNRFDQDNKRRITIAEGEIDTLQADLNTAESNITTAEGEIDTLQADLNTAESDITTAESEIDTLQADLNTAESEIDTLQADLNTAESDIITLQSSTGSGSGGGLSIKQANDIDSAYKRTRNIDETSVKTKKEILGDNVMFHLFNSATAISNSRLSSATWNNIISDNDKYIGIRINKDDETLSALLAKDLTFKFYEYDDVVSYTFDDFVLVNETSTYKYFVDGVAADTFNSYNLREGFLNTPSIYYYTNVLGTSITGDMGYTDEAKSSINNFISHPTTPPSAFNHTHGFSSNALLTRAVNTLNALGAPITIATPKDIKFNLLKLNGSVTKDTSLAKKIAFTADVYNNAQHNRITFNDNSNNSHTFSPTGSEHIGDIDYFYMNIPDEIVVAEIEAHAYVDSVSLDIVQRIISNRSIIESLSVLHNEYSRFAGENFKVTSTDASILTMNALATSMNLTLDVDSYAIETNELNIDTRDTLPSGKSILCGYLPSQDAINTTDGIKTLCDISNFAEGSNIPIIQADGYGIYAIGRSQQVDHTHRDTIYPSLPTGLNAYGTFDVYINRGAENHTNSAISLNINLPTAGNPADITIHMVPYLNGNAHDPIILTVPNVQVGTVYPTEDEPVSITTQEANYLFRAEAWFDGTNLDIRFIDVNGNNDNLVGFFLRTRVSWTHEYTTNDIVQDKVLLQANTYPLSFVFAVEKGLNNTYKIIGSQGELQTDYSIDDKMVLNFGESGRKAGYINYSAGEPNISRIIPHFPADRGFGLIEFENKHTVKVTAPTQLIVNDAKGLSHNVGEELRNEIKTKVYTSGTDSELVYLANSETLTFTPSLFNTKDIISLTFIAKNGSENLYMTKTIYVSLYENETFDEVVSFLPDFRSKFAFTKNGNHIIIDLQETSNSSDVDFYNAPYVKLLVTYK